MGMERGSQRLVMQDERNLHRAKGDDERAHDEALAGQIIEHVRHIHEIREQERAPNNHCAHQHHDAGPLEHVTESSHGEAEQILFAKAQPFDPCQANRDQVNLDVNAEEIFENERDRVDGRRHSEELCRRLSCPPLRQSPERDRFHQGRDRADEQHQIDQVSPKAVTFSERADERDVQTAPVDDQQHGRDDREWIQLREG